MQDISKKKKVEKNERWRNARKKKEGEEQETRRKEKYKKLERRN